MEALLLFSHGSLLCGFGEALEAHASRLRERYPTAAVEIGYLNYAAPSFSDAVERLAAGGATTITVVPYFLVTGYFVTRALPREIEREQARFPHLTFAVAPALDFDAALAEAILAAAETAVGPAAWDDPLRRAAAQCLPRVDCPLYGTPDCPKVGASE